MKEITLSRKKLNSKYYEHSELPITYDDTRFDIIHAKKINKVLLVRKVDGEILYEFDDMYTKTISQYDHENQTYFIVTEWIRPKDERKLYDGCKLTKYKLYYEEQMKEDLSFKCDDLEKVNDTSYIIHENGVYEIYNVGEDFSLAFNKAAIRTSDENNKEVWVQQEVTDRYNHTEKDILEYKIDPTTFKILSPIRSLLQHRYIMLKDSYTYDEIIEELNKQGFFSIACEYADNMNDKATIQIEILNHLNKIAQNMEIIDREKYGDEVEEAFNYDGSIKEEIVKKFNSQK